MKPLSVYEYRGYHVINAARVGGKVRAGNYATKTEARVAADELLAKHTLGLIAQPVKLQLVKDAAAAFISRTKERIGAAVDPISRAHFEDVERSLRFCLNIKIDGKVFAKHDIAKLVCKENKGELADAFVNAIAAEYRMVKCSETGKLVRKNASKSTQEKRIKGLKQFLNHCQVKGWIDLNPLDKVSLGYSEELSDRAPRIQPETIQQLISAGLQGETLVSRAMVITALSTGMRQGELRALTWGAVDLPNGEVHVRQAVAHGRGMNIKAPKTKRGFRVIPIPAETVQLLRQLKMQSKFSRDQDYAFATAAGLPKQKKTLRELIERASKRAGIERMVWGDMRHFFASVQLSGLGEDWAEVAGLMGHSNSAFTYRQYGHYVKNEKKQDKARSAAASAIFGSV